MFDPTVGQVSGLIALGVLIVQITLPLAAVVVLVGFLADDNTAVTWSVVGRLLQSSWWPTILQADATATRGVRLVPVAVSWLVLLATLLLSVASLVTPFGLTDAVASSVSTVAPFRYAPDLSAFGQGTLPPPSLPFSRLCSVKLSSRYVHYPCPGALLDNATINPRSGNLSKMASPVPRNVSDIFSSATSARGGSLSGIFDLLPRHYVTRTRPEIDGGRPYLEATFRPLDKIILGDRLELFEGLIVDSRAAGLGFRNHSATGGFVGASWTEDITWLEPVTECVDSNVSLRFTIADKDGSASDVRLRDDGGFSEPRPRPEPVRIDEASTDPDLRGRAYNAAWALNAVSALALNLTTEADFPRIVAGAPGKDYDVSPAANQFEGYRADRIRIRTLGRVVLDSMKNATSDRRMDVTRRIEELKSDCQAFDPDGQRNLSSVLVRCYALHGAPRRSDGSDPRIMEPRSEWEQSIFTCASSTRASVKEVTFGANGTASLSNTRVLGVRDKALADILSKPVWAVEKAELTSSFITNPLWGLVDEKFAGDRSLWRVRGDSMFLPGVSPLLALDDLQDSLVGAAVPGAAWTSLLKWTELSSDSLTELAGDYSGQTTFALLSLWQRLSRDASSAPRIVNLIYTDLLSSALIGSRSRLDPAASAAAATPADVSTFDVVTYSRRVQYQLVYAIPAVIILALWLAVLAFALFSVIFSRFSFRRLRGLVNHTGAGRAFTTGNVSEFGSPAQRTCSWLKRDGRSVVKYLDGGEATDNVEETHSQKA
ncbi:MAG: hypothetical protein M1832_003348 [Thelocarpon impressellum]|nr:MAG: hypothetical protein M1832_003348 [Thelocarpon impressellum]